MNRHNKHRPFHIYDGHTYFLTGRMLEGFKILSDDKKKHFLQSKLAELSIEMNIGILAWSILDNHYHILCMLRLSEDEVVENTNLTTDKLAFVTPNETKGVVNASSPKDARGEKLVRFLRRLHSISSKKFNLEDKTPSRKIWYQYWDYCIRNQADFWIHFNYIIEQPLKHGLVKILREAYNYKYSSNPVWLERFGEEGLSESFIKYPVKDWTPSEDG